ncbi:MAG: endonuclease/exonuclease/phosphatase family protein [Planctomycetota bacterium]
MRTLLAALLLASTGLLGCTAPQPIVVDGFTHDWPAAPAARAADPRGDAAGPTDVLALAARRTEDAFYLKLRLAEDANLHKPDDGGGLRITVANAAESLTLDTGLRQLERDGTPIPFAEADYIGLPTHADDTFEIRLRLAPAPGPVTVSVAGSDTLDAPLRLGAMEAWQDPPPIDIARGDTPLRVVAWNVLHGGPFGDPDREADGRAVLAALDADVLLLQEVWEIDDLPDRVRALCGPDWSVVESGGVAVATNLPMTPLDLAPLSDDADQRGDSWANRRNLFAGIDTPVGPIVVVSSHWKCCGRAGSTEDLQRMDDALHALKAIWRLREGGVEGEWDRATRTRPIVKPVPDRFQHAPLVVAGDYNLVGSRDPLDMLLTTGLVELVPVQTHDNTAATWRDPREAQGTPDDWQPGGFPPGRLDFVAVDPRLKVIRSFVADLGESTLLSDHLPVVVDVSE